jgi:hypothetical protein
MTFLSMSALTPRYETIPKLFDFGQRSDVVLGILKRDNLDSLTRITMGTAVTNLARMGFPSNYGDLELERLILHPGGPFPLVNVNLVLGAVTCSGRLGLLLEWVEQNIDLQTMERIRDEAMRLLRG